MLPIEIQQLTKKNVLTALSLIGYVASVDDNAKIMAHKMQTLDNTW